MFIFCSWFQKKHPRTIERVQFPPQADGGDALRSMTVIPYIEALHSPDSATPSEEEEEVDEDFRAYGSPGA
jgi:hypothetical protein